MPALPIRGLYAVTPDPRESPGDERRWLEGIEAALAAGVPTLQYRDKTGDATLRGARARALAARCTAHGARLIVNDDPALAAAAGAHGVHLGRDDGSVAAARAALGAHALVGVSCYDSLERARAARDDGADYIAFGAMFPSGVKPGAVRAPLSLLAAGARETGLPVVAIGGIGVGRVAALVAAGADALAVISAVFAAPDPAAAVRAFNAALDDAFAAAASDRQQGERT
jgi:thiamine-phosphate pyrophosphorylase